MGQPMRKGITVNYHYTQKRENTTVTFTLLRMALKCRTDNHDDLTPLMTAPPTPGHPTCKGFVLKQMVIILWFIQGHCLSKSPIRAEVRTQHSVASKKVGAVPILDNFEPLYYYFDKGWGEDEVTCNDMSCCAKAPTE